MKKQIRAEGLTSWAVQNTKHYTVSSATGRICVTGGPFESESDAKAAMGEEKWEVVLGKELRAMSEASAVETSLVFANLKDGILRYPEVGHAMAARAAYSTKKMEVMTNGLQFIVCNEEDAADLKKIGYKKVADQAVTEAVAEIQAAAKEVASGTRPFRRALKREADFDIKTSDYWKSLQKKLKGKTLADIQALLTKAERYKALAAKAAGDMTDRWSSAVRNHEAYSDSAATHAEVIADALGTPEAAALAAQVRAAAKEVAKISFDHQAKIDASLDKTESGDFKAGDVVRVKKTGEEVKVMNITKSGLVFTRSKDAKDGPAGATARPAAGYQEYMPSELEPASKTEDEDAPRLRLLQTFTAGKRVAKVYKDLDWGEFRTKFYVDGVHQKNADSHTDDKQDAVDTANSWTKQTSVGEAGLPKVGMAKNPDGSRLLPRDAGEFSGKPITMTVQTESSPRIQAARQKAQEWMAKNSPPKGNKYFKVEEPTQVVVISAPAGVSRQDAIASGQSKSVKTFSFSESAIKEAEDIQFWIVTKPNESSLMVDILFKSSVREMERQYKGGLEADEIVEIFSVDEEEAARAYAQQLLDQAFLDMSAAAGGEAEVLPMATPTRQEGRMTRDQLDSLWAKFQDCERECNETGEATTAGQRMKRTRSFNEFKRACQFMNVDPAREVMNRMTTKPKTEAEGMEGTGWYVVDANQKPLSPQFDFESDAQTFQEEHLDGKGTVVYLQLDDGKTEAGAFSLIDAAKQHLGPDIQVMPKVQGNESYTMVKPAASPSMSAVRNFGKAVEAAGMSAIWDGDQKCFKVKRVTEAKLKGDLDVALAYMMNDIADGSEFPDAAFRAAQKFNVSQPDLEAAYDSFEPPHSDTLPMVDQFPETPEVTEAGTGLPARFDNGDDFYNFVYETWPDPGTYVEHQGGGAWLADIKGDPAVNFATFDEDSGVVSWNSGDMDDEADPVELTDEQMAAWTPPAAGVTEVDATGAALPADNAAPSTGAVYSGFAGTNVYPDRYYVISDAARFLSPSPFPTVEAAMQWVKDNPGVADLNNGDSVISGAEFMAIYDAPGAQPPDDSMIPEALSDEDRQMMMAYWELPRGLKTAISEFRAERGLPAGPKDVVDAVKAMSDEQRETMFTVFSETGSAHEAMVAGGFQFD